MLTALLCFLQVNHSVLFLPIDDAASTRTNNKIFFQKTTFCVDFLLAPCILQGLNASYLTFVFDLAPCPWIQFLLFMFPTVSVDWNCLLDEWQINLWCFLRNITKLSKRSGIDVKSCSKHHHVSFRLVHISTRALHSSSPTSRADYHSLHARFSDVDDAIDI